MDTGERSEFSREQGFRGEIVLNLRYGMALVLGGTFAEPSNSFTSNRRQPVICSSEEYGH